MKIAIVTDDNAGFTKEEASKYNIFIIKMPVIINGETRFQGESLSEDEFYRLLESDAEVHTSREFLSLIQ